jgi:glycosyltransferase involved in cell wall biosynthesis
LVQGGDEVEWFAASFPGAAQTEVVDGVRVVRRGRQWTVHLRAFQHYRGKLRGRFDVVIDQVNTVPFFTPLWAGIPVFMMIWQLAREVWWYESPFPLSALGYMLEPIYLRAYRHVPVLTFSASTETDLRHLGFRGAISVVPVGIAPVDAALEMKSPEPRFVYVGRLAPSKRINEILQAFALFRQSTGKGRLALVGDGASSYVDRLQRLAIELDLRDSVEFCGWLRGPAKSSRMSEARALLMASAREGWGLVVTECNACGTPAIVYDVPGLRDSVQHMKTGLVVTPAPRPLAEGMLKLVGDPELYERLRQAAQRWSQTLTYEASTQIVLETMASAVISEA